MNQGKRHIVVKVLRTAEEVENEVAGRMTGTTTDINARSGVATTNILRHLKAMNFIGECHIHSWVQSNATWVARWVSGPGENSVVPRRSPEEQREHSRKLDRERFHRLKAKHRGGEEITPSKALRLTDEFLARAKQTPATWFSPLTM